MATKSWRFNEAEAGEIVFKFVGFLSEDEERFSRFLALTGLQMADFRQRLATPSFQLMILDQVLQDQTLVLKFTGSVGLPDEAVLLARDALLRRESTLD